MEISSEMPTEEAVSSEGFEDDDVTEID